MGNRDKRLGPFRQVLVPQVYTAVFRHHVLCLETGRDHSGTRCKVRNNLAFSFHCPGRKSDEGLAAFGQCRAVHEVVLASYAGENHVADTVRANLSGNIHLDGGIDSHCLRILTDALRVIGPRNIVEHSIFIMVQIFIHVTGTEGKTSDTASRFDLLAGIVNDSRLHETENTIRHGFGMESEVLVVFQSVQNRIWNTSDTDLQCRTVRNFLGNV